MSLQVYNTLSRKKEPFPKKPGETVTMYVCGPTVYKPSHIGHMVGPVIFDTVKRYLTYLGYKVNWVVNITDVDDKLIKRAAELGTSVPVLAEKMTKDYVECLNRLNVKVLDSSGQGVDVMPKATEHIQGMIEMIAKLIEKGYAYPADGDVYFDVSKDHDYGKLCNRDPEQLEAGARIEVSERKRNPGDFALWKGAKPGEPKEVIWQSPWGPGRPGWHIECSVMSTKLLGETLDIHGGGLDLQFPHHENELAQSESATGREFARCWMHNGLLQLRDKDGKPTKMAGSLGNVLNVEEALKHMGGDALRFFMLKTHYRTPIDLGIWDWKNPATPIPEGMVETRKAHQTFLRFAERVQRISGTPFASLPALTVADPKRKFVQPAFTESYRRFLDYMADDFNTGGVVGVLFDLVTPLNKLADDTKLEDPATNNANARAEFIEGATLLKEIIQVLGLTLTTEEKSLDAGNEFIAGLMQLLIDLRNNLRAEAKKIAAKDDPTKKALFEQTDVIRKRLGELGVVLEDRPGGTSWRKA